MPIQVKCPTCGLQLSAPDNAAGKQAQCPSCKTTFKVPEVVHDAEAIGAEEIPLAGPATPFSPAAPAPATSPFGGEDVYGLSQPAPTAGGAEGEPPRRPCPVCGEMIVATAAKCRFCGAVFDLSLKQSESKKRAKAEDSDLSGVEWVFCILCAGIACIVGIVYAIQGKPKGMKMVGVAILAAIVWNVISVLIQLASESGSHGFR
jgi:hypothetical protein